MYHILVEGTLNSRWADYFEGFIMATSDQGETLLSGPIVDQAELHGVLGRIRDLSLPLIMVAKNDFPCAFACSDKPKGCRINESFHYPKDIFKK